MRIRPRQQLLDLWRAVLAYSYRDEKWVWGGRDGSNSISDAEQLLCLLYPATAIAAFALDQPNEMAADAKAALSPFGEETRIGGVLVGLLEDYFARYTGPDGQPVFAAGSYLHSSDDTPPTEAQLALEVVDSYSMSLSLCIAALRFLRGFERFVSGEVRMEARQLRERIPVAIDRAGARLTAAMAGLVRSFVIHTPEPKSDAGQSILRMLNQNHAPPEEIIGQLSARLEQLRVQAANEVKLSQTSDVDIADDERLFECGWGWGVVATAEPIDFVPGHIGAAPGHAESRPYLYFTAVALDGIIDLSSQRIRELDLLTDEQRKLADALQLRFELTRTYWSTVARFGGNWPLEDIPWRTSDGEESDYFSLAVTAMLIQDLVYRESTEDLARTVAIFDRLARRGRITSRLTSDDPAAGLHHPGVRLRLSGSAGIGGGPLLQWHVPDFATLMLKRCLEAARMRTDVGTRDRLMGLIESAMDHLDRCVLRDGPAPGLWDDTGWIFGDRGNGPEGPSWFVTERMMESLVIAYGTFSEPPLAPDSMVARAVDLLSEAEHLLNQEELEVEGDDLSPRQVAVDRIRQSLDRARHVLRERPGTAYSLSTQALIQLDELAYARQDATR
ncbi:SCO2524 family protein [Nocardia wallacei]|uniref:SCO2524 family protein n=1 Tax=Nocardia wallacei TaxID=480035 RepID=UPI002453DF2F|nr:SCO2524 family protein [Nocardia wallacei]